MAILSALFNSRQTNHYSQAFPGTRDCTSAAMQKAIEDWFQLYYAADVSENEKEDPCQRIPVAVVSKLQKACFGEYSAQIAAVGRKNEFMEHCQAELDAVRKKAVQLAMIGGEAWLKPIPAKDRFRWAVVRRDCVAVLGRDGSGRATDLISTEKTRTAHGWYTLLERRKIDPAGYLTIENKLYWSSEKDSLGTPTALSSLPQYEKLEPQYTYPQPIGSIGMVSLRMPTENTVDGSPDGVSVFAPAAGLIHNINHNEWLLNQEFDNGASRVFASSDLLRRRKDHNGRTTQQELPAGLFVGLDEDPKTTGITIFSPQLREQSFLVRKNEYLRNVESVLGIKRGLLCEVADVQRTATEVASSAGDYSLTVQDLQEVWESADRQALQLCDQLGQLYKLCPAGAFDPDEDLSISFGNGVLFDADKAHAENMQMVAAGLLKPELALAWKYGLPWDTSKDLAAIRKKYMPEMEHLVDEETEEE